MSCDGTQIRIAEGCTMMRSLSVSGLSPPSTSHTTGRSKRTLTLAPRDVVTKGDRSALPSTTRPTVRTHWLRLLAVTMPTSSRPSSGRAPSKSSIPPNAEPTLPTRTQVTVPE